MALQQIGERGPPRTAQRYDDKGLHGGEGKATIDNPDPWGNAEVASRTWKIKAPRNFTPAFRFLEQYRRVCIDQKIGLRRSSDLEMTL